MNLGTATVIRGDARRLPLPDDSVDLVVTSQPYYALRSYTDAGEHYAGQIGSEPTPAEFLDALIECTREWVRVLKPSGSLFVNLGDKYVTDNRGSGGDAKRGEAKHAPAGRMGYVGEGIMPRKSLMGLPWRYAIRCIDDLGLILRAELIWSKPNGLPESVTDRVRRSHEQWFHFTLQPRYFSAVDEIREPHKPGQSPTALSFARVGRETAPGQSCAPHRLERDDQGLNPLGKLPGSVWTVATEPLRVPESLGIDHFAAFPTEWPKRLILGWSPAGICEACGVGRRPVTEAEYDTQGRTTNGPKNEVRKGLAQAADRVAIIRSGVRAVRETTITGYACACPEPTAPTRPAVVLDPFGGTGTTALVAKALGRHGITVDMSADYCRVAEWRTNDRDQLAKVLDIPKAEQQPADQLDMLDLLAAGGDS